MARVVFTPNIQRHVACPETEAAGATVREVLDDQKALRRHMAIFVDGVLIRDRVALSDPVEDGSTVYVFQALSGG
jgi:sulfur-carrier protein